MFEKKSVLLTSVYSLLAAIISSLIFSSLFGKLYLFLFNPIPTCGFSGLDCNIALGVIQNSIFAYIFFLPLFIMFFVSRKQWLSWLILIFIPFTMVLVGGSKHILWFFIFTFAGGLIGWLINLAIKKFKSEVKV
ncbi:MAG: hypothetical protein PHF50_01515 [Patescibacteria group bacterium]|nr:hypothetical protein [Patescibacteria group bacterium]